MIYSAQVNKPHIIVNKMNPNTSTTTNIILAFNVAAINTRNNLQTIYVAEMI
jgi:hypothetical protein